MLQTDHVEQFLQYLYQAMNQDPVWQGKGLKVFTGVKVITGVLCAWESHCKFIRYWLNANILRWYGTPLLCDVHFIEVYNKIRCNFINTGTFFPQIVT